MSRMLEALRRIEAKTAALADAIPARSPVSAAQSEPGPEVQRRALAALERLDSAVADLSLSPDEPLAGEALDAGTAVAGGTAPSHSAHSVPAQPGQTTAELRASVQVALFSSAEQEARPFGFAQAHADAAAGGEPGVACAAPPSSLPEALAESCLRLADNILSRLPGGPSAAVFLADVGQSEARTELLAGLLPALARRDGSELLAVDADLERGQLTARLGVLAARGVAQVLLRACAWQEALSRTCLPGVSLLPSAVWADPEGRLLRPYRWERLLAELRRRYRLIVVDGGSLPRGGAVAAARCCDAAYLVVCLGQTAYREAAAAAALLRSQGARVEGCIALSADADQAGY